MINWKNPSKISLALGPLDAEVAEGRKVLSSEWSVWIRPIAEGARLSLRSTNDFELYILMQELNLIEYSLECTYQN